MSIGTSKTVLPQLQAEKFSTLDELPRSTGTRCWEAFRHLIARSGLDRMRLFRILANGGGELLVSALSKVRGLELIPEVPWIIRLQFLLGWYETDTVAVCRKWIRPGMTVLDIGAHTGYFSTLFSRLVGPAGRVYAFEPSEPTYRLLRRNLAQARYKNVVPVPKAASAQSGVTEFFEMNHPLTHSMFNFSSFVTGFEVRRKVSIECVTVDEFLAAQGNPQIQFIKMDIEGAEPLALSGMRATIARSPQLAMVVEFSPCLLRTGGCSPADFLTQLAALGFTPHLIVAGTLLPVTSNLVRMAEPSSVNLLCVKNSG